MEPPFDSSVFKLHLCERRCVGTNCFDSEKLCRANEGESESARVSLLGLTLPLSVEEAVRYKVSLSLLENVPVSFLVLN